MVARRRADSVFVGPDGVQKWSTKYGQPTGLFAQDANRNGNTFSAGLGFVIANRLSIMPRVVVPFGPLDESGLQITFGYNWLHR